MAGSGSDFSITVCHQQVNICSAFSASTYSNRWSWHRHPLTASSKSTVRAPRHWHRSCRHKLQRCTQHRYHIKLLLINQSTWSKINYGNTRADTAEDTIYVINAWPHKLKIILKMQTHVHTSLFIDQILLCLLFFYLGTTSRFSYLMSMGLSICLYTHVS